MKRLGPSDLVVLQYANGKTRNLSHGINFHSPLAYVVFRGNLVYNRVELDASPYLTQDCVSVLLSAQFVFTVKELDDLGKLKSDLNSWLRHQAQLLVGRRIRDVSLDRLFCATNQVEEDIRAELGELTKAYGLECQSAFFNQMVPPPDVLGEFESLARTKLASEEQRESMEASYRLKRQLMEEHNTFTITETKRMTEAYGAILGSLAVHFETEGGCKAAQALSNPNFLAPLHLMRKEMAHIGEEMAPTAEDPSHTTFNTTSEL